MKLGTVLKQAREQKRMSQEEVALELQVSQKTYANYEMNKTTPSIQSLSILAEFLEIDIIEALERDGIIFNRTSNELKNQNTGIINQLPEKLIAQYEERLKEKDAQIKWLRSQINRF